MAKFIKGDIVVLAFPFTDLITTKKRPAYVAATPQGNDIILCQITSQYYKDPYSIKIEDQDFIEGSLNQISYINQYFG
ncbi:MAG: type II toxin-antitoxin system PemK/MazF family toxin [Chloroherpetonaceae bacterium]